MHFVGTRVGTSLATLDLWQKIAAREGVASVAIASAYWDSTATAYARRLAEHVGGPVRLLLWTAGGTRAAWAAAQADAADPLLDLRFIDSPEGGGIFHAKVAGAEGADGAWLCCLVGSGNLTDAGLRKNVELGVIVNAEDSDLTGVRQWFETQFAAATPASTIDFELALSVAPAKSEAAERRAIFARAALASPAPAGVIQD